MRQLLLQSLLLLLSLLTTIYSQAQVGIGTNTPNSNAVLELKSPGNNQGLLVPRLSTAERTAISGLSSAEKGLLVFDTNDNKFYYWSGVAWIVIEDSVGTGTVTNINTGSSLTGGPITVNGTIDLADNGVTTAKILNGAVTSAKILDGAIATADLANSAVTAGKLANTAVSAGSYGTSTQVSQITVDAQGRITGAANTTIAGVAPGGGAGGDLTGTYPNPTVANNAITSAKILDGTVSSADITDGTIATADLANGSVTATKLGNTAVTAGSYGTGTQIPQIIIDAQGRITGAVNVAITGAAPTGAAGGDLTGSYPNPAITNNAVTTAKLADNSVNSAKIIDGTILVADLADGAVSSAKVLDGTLVNSDINGAAAIEITKVAGGTNGQVLLTSGTTPTWSNMPQPTGAAGGDLTGSYPNPIVTTNAITTAKLADNSVTSAKIVDGTILVADLADGSVTSAKVLDLTITTADLANTAVTDAKIASGITVSKLSPGTNGQVLTTVAGSTAWANPPASGTVTSVATGVGLTGGPITTSGTISLANTSVGAGSYGSATQVPQITVDAQGRLTAAINTTISGVVPGGTANGDLNGTYPNPTVDGLQGRAVAATAPVDGQVLKWNGTATAWTPSTDNNSAFSLPYTAIQSDAGTLLSITNQGAGRAAQFFVDNASSNTPALSVSTNGTGIALVANGNTFGVSGASTVQNGAAGVFNNTADRGFGVYGVLQTTGTASYGALGYTYINDGTPFGVGLFGLGRHYGIRASGPSAGGQIFNTSNTHQAIIAGNGAGVWARSDEDFGNGVAAFGFGTTSSYGLYAGGTTGGVYSYSDGHGVEAYSNSTTSSYGVYGRHLQATGTNSAIRGETSSTAALAEAVTGVVLSTTPGGSSAAIRGINNGTAGSGIGVWGSHAGSGWGIYGTATGTGWAIYGNNTNATGYAGYFSGRVNISGALSKGSGTFKIDHPLDPANKFLYHSFVESPDMKNIYDGVIVLDADGQADITLPDWFSALNKDFRYQLTCIGGFAQVYVSREVMNNSFSIAGGKPGMKVSWQLTGIRKDPYAEKNRVVVEEDKPADERGKYLYPDAYGLPETMGIGYSQQQTQGVNNKQNEPVATRPSAEQVRQNSERFAKDPNLNKSGVNEVKIPKID